MKPIYLDYNSTAPIAPEVIDTIVASFREGFVNPASQHRPGQRARTTLEELRREIMNMLDARTTGRNPDRLVFTSGGTESNNLALTGLVGSPPGRVLISAIEHPSVLGAAENLVRLGFEVRLVKVDQNGVCDLNHFAELINDESSPIKLVSVMLANNETGVIQPVPQIAQLCRERNIPVHCDAVQAVAKIKCSFQKLNVDSLAFTAHKFQGPRGIGGLLLRDELIPQPMLFGGFQQMAIRPGTEDVALVAGMHRALQLFLEDPESKISCMTRLREQLAKNLATEIPDLVVNGSGAERVPHTLNLSFPGVNRQEFLMAADMAELAISTGSACASGSSDPSHVLVAMNLPASVIEGSIRISLGVPTKESEINEACNRILLIYNNLRRSK